jgi:DNA mismatch repair protein MutS
LSLLQNAIDDDPPSTPEHRRDPRRDIRRSWIRSSRPPACPRLDRQPGSGERQKDGDQTLKVGYNKVFGYYIEISRGAAEKAPENYIRKQTLVNAERFITPEMKEYETLVLNAEDRIREIELRLFKESLRDPVKSAHQAAGGACPGGAGRAVRFGGGGGPRRLHPAPGPRGGSELEIHEGRHPVVEQSLQGERYIPNDVIFEQGEIVRVITGPNMSGKSRICGRPR